MFLLFESSCSNPDPKLPQISKMNLLCPKNRIKRFNGLWGDDGYACGAESILDFGKYLIEKDVEEFVM